MPKYLLITLIIVGGLILLLYFIFIASLMNKASKNKFRRIRKKYLSWRRIVWSLVISSVSILISLSAACKYNYGTLSQVDITNTIILTFAFSAIGFFLYAAIDGLKYDKVIDQGNFWIKYRNALKDSEKSGTINIINTSDIDDFFSPLGLRYLAEQLILKPENVTINRLFVLPDNKKILNNTSIHNLGNANTWFDFDKMLHNLITLSCQEKVNLFFVTEFEIMNLFNSHFPYEKSDWDIINIGEVYYKAEDKNNCLFFNESHVDENYRKMMKTIINEYFCESRKLENYPHFVKNTLSA